MPAGLFVPFATHSAAKKSAQSAREISLSGRLVEGGRESGGAFGWGRGYMVDPSYPPVPPPLCPLRAVFRRSWYGPWHAPGR